MTQQVESGVPEVRRGVGLYLSSVSVFLQHPQLGSRVHVDLFPNCTNHRDKTPQRFLDLLARAKKGFEWTVSHAEETRDDEDE